MGKATGFNAELTALGAVLKALEPLEEDKQQFVLRTAMDRLGITAAASGPRSLQGSAPLGNAGSSPQLGTGILEGVTAKAFMASKRPTTDVQRMACLAYYLTHARGTTQFKTNELTKLNTDAAGDRFSNPAVAVMNATSGSGFLAPAGGGKKQITSLGEEVVGVLPDQERVKAVIAEAKTSRRKKRSTKKKNKQKAWKS
jgi:hypothetical protein